MNNRALFNVNYTIWESGIRHAVQFLEIAVNHHKENGPKSDRGQCGISRLTDSGLVNVIGRQNNLVRGQ